MSYEKIVSQVEFAIRQEVRHLEVHNELLDKCQTTEPNFAEISAIALCLHAFYNGIEGIFLSIAKEIDEFVPNSSSSHKELLNQIAKANDKRQAVISLNLKEKLTGYLLFRHFIRHAYPHFLEWNRFEELAYSLREVWKQTRREIEAFLETLWLIK